MKHLIFIGKTQDLEQTLAAAQADVYEKAKPPGQYVIKDQKTGRVLKCVTITGFTSRVEQSYGEQLDINRLLEPAIRKGLLRHGLKFEGEYDDIPVGDFMEAQLIIAKGKSMFEALPAAIRTKFDGKPEKFMAFVQDPKNAPWLKEQGILKGLDGMDKDGNPTGYNPAAEQAAKEAAHTATDPEAK